MESILALSGCDQAELLRKRQLTSSELVRAHLDRIAAINGRLNAVVDVLRDAALSGAAESDVRLANGTARPLEGVPFSVKDSIEVRGTVCSAGTLGYRNRPVSSRDATLVARLRNAGAIPLARTNLPDLLFAFESDNLIFGRTNNPWDPGRTSGGSSGGEAALIAACGSPFGLGSDAAGSVRLPAHYCGISALKPTSGRLARTGHVPPAGGWIESLWQIGPMARHVADLSAMMQLLAGPDGEDRTALPVPFLRPESVRGLRVAFFTDNGVLAADPATQAVVRNAAVQLEQAGAIVEAYLPPPLERAYDLEMRFLGPDGGFGLRSFLNDIGSTRTHPLLNGWLDKLERHRVSLAGFAALWSELDDYRSAMFALLGRFDAILSPVAALPAVPHGTSVSESVFPGYSYTMAHNLTGWPAAVVRCGTSPEGLPIGVQVAAGPWCDGTALALAGVLESRCGGWSAPGRF